jgi:hypothetical protein
MDDCLKVLTSNNFHPISAQITDIVDVLTGRLGLTNHPFVTSSIASALLIPDF